MCPMAERSSPGGRTASNAIVEFFFKVLFFKVEYYCNFFLLSYASQQATRSRKGALLGVGHDRIKKKKIIVFIDDHIS